MNRLLRYFHPRRPYRPSSDAARECELQRRNNVNTSAWYQRRVKYLTGRSVQDILQTAVTP